MNQKKRLKNRIKHTYLKLYLFYGWFTIPNYHFPYKRDKEIMKTIKIEITDSCYEFIKKICDDHALDFSAVIESGCDLLKSYMISSCENFSTFNASQLAAEDSPTVDKPSDKAVD